MSVSFKSLILYHKSRHGIVWLRDKHVDYSDGARTCSLKDKCPDSLKSVGHLSWCD